MNNMKIKSFVLCLLFVFSGIIVTKYIFDYLSSRANFKFQKLSTPLPPKQNLTELRHKETLPVEEPKSSNIPTEELKLSKIPITGPKFNKKTDYQKWILNGICLSDNKAYALINNYILKEGDKIGEAIVEKIKTTGVVLKLKDKTLTLTTK